MDKPDEKYLTDWVEVSSRGVHEQVNKLFKKSYGKKCTQLIKVSDRTYLAKMEPDLFNLKESA